MYEPKKGVLKNLFEILNYNNNKNITCLVWLVILEKNGRFEKLPNVIKNIY